MTRKYVRRAPALSKTVRVRPRPGFILAGIPASGADVPRKLAEEWITNGLVQEMKPASPADSEG